MQIQVDNENVAEDDDADATVAEDADSATFTGYKSCRSERLTASTNKRRQYVQNVKRSRSSRRSLSNYWWDWIFVSPSYAILIRYG